jgi:cell division protein FtsW
MPKQNQKTRRRTGQKKRRAQKERVSGRCDYSLLAACIILICLGLVMLYSASAYGAEKMLDNGMYYLIRQGRASLLALAVALAVSRFDYHTWMKNSWMLYAAAMVLMLLVRIIGKTENGATRWLVLGPVRFQPAEIAKLAVVLFIPYVILCTGKNFHTPKGAFFVLAIAALPGIGAYVFTENLSTGIIILAIGFAVVFLAHPNTKLFLGIIGALTVSGAGMFALSIMLNGAGSFRNRRVLVWLNPEQYEDSGAYQILQGLYAIGSGGLLGKGLGNSAQKLSTIPEPQNDMIFTIVCEELGLFGAVVLLILFGYVLYRLFSIAMEAPDLYGSLVAAGVFVHVALQVILNICVVLNVIPATGVTLPFVSYGGTSVVFLMVEIGLALSISRERTPEKKQRKAVPEIDKRVGNY